VPARARRRVAATLAAALLFAAATPWALRPWFLHGDEFPRSQSTVARWPTPTLPERLDPRLGCPRARQRAAGRSSAATSITAPHTLAGSENMLATRGHGPRARGDGKRAERAEGDGARELRAERLASSSSCSTNRQRRRGLVAGAPSRRAVAPGTMPQPQYLGTQYLPLALLAVDCWLARRACARSRLAAALALQALACFTSATSR